MRKLLSFSAALAAAALLAGCATPQKMYASKGPANLIIKTRVATGAALDRAAAALDIHRMESRCQLEYEGRVWFDDAETPVALPVDQPMFLSFGFVSKEWWSMSAGTVRQNTTFVAKPGYVYVAEVSYVRGIYDVVLKETRAGVAGSRVLELRPPAPC